MTTFGPEYDGPDIVVWLRAASNCLWNDQAPIPDRLQQAALEIERLRKALKAVVDFDYKMGPGIEWVNRIKDIADEALG